MDSVKQIAEFAERLERLASTNKWKKLQRKANAIKLACNQCYRIFMEEVGGNTRVNGNGIKSIGVYDMDE